MIVSNSTPLIYLSKLGHLPLLRKLYGKVNVPSEVMMEVMRGKQLGFDDAAVVEKAGRDGWLKVVELGSGQKRELLTLRRTFDDISEADAAALVLAKDLSATLCIDDSRAARVAEILGLKHIGTFGIILLATEKKLMSGRQAEKLVLSLPEQGFYMGPDLLAEFLKQLKRQPR